MSVSSFFYLSSIPLFAAVNIKMFVRSCCRRAEETSAGVFAQRGGTVRFQVRHAEALVSQVWWETHFEAEFRPTQV